MSANNDHSKRLDQPDKVVELNNHKSVANKVEPDSSSNKMVNEEVQKALKHKDNHVQLISTLQSKLYYAWITWLLYRGLIFPILLSVLLSTHPDIVGGIAWQWLWLAPAFIISPWMISGKSPYALLLSSMLTLVYLGASGVVLFERFYDTSLSMIWAYAIDTLLLLVINVLVFKLLKQLPSMNKVD